MAKYCDSKELETIWGDWEVAIATPELDSLRKSRRLYKQVHGANILYCIAIHDAFFFGVGDPGSGVRTVENPNIIMMIAGNHPIDNDVTASLTQNNFQLDLPGSTSWERLIAMIYAICTGLALK